MQSAVETLRIAIDDESLHKIQQSISAKLVGYGVLTPLVNLHPTDIVVNSADSVWADCGDGLVRSHVTFESEDHVRRLAQRLAHSAHRRLDDAEPFVDALLSDGARLHAALSPLAQTGTSISLRFPHHRKLPLTSWFDESNRAIFSKLISALELGRSVIVSGATGSGKTTLIRSMIDEYYQNRRVVIVEDVAELNIRTPHVVSLQGRSANAEGFGAISMRTLVRQTLRMRPDSIVVGELRGAEALDWLLAVSSGHRGSLTTVHAADVQSSRKRIALLCALADVDAVTVNEVLKSSDFTFVHCERQGNVRRVVAVESGMIS
jgi:pilus assembly protein CpaF